MPRKSWIDRVVETGDWSEGEKKAARALRKSAALISQNTGDAEPVDTGEATATLAEAYEHYRERGGNRALSSELLAHLGPTPIDQIDREVLIAAARELYPRSTQDERARLVYDPVDEIIGIGFSTSPASPPPVSGLVRRNPGPHKSWAEQRAEYERERAEFYAQTARVGALMRALAAGDWKRVRELQREMGFFISEGEEERRRELDRAARYDPRNWAAVSNFKPPSDPPDPPPDTSRAPAASSEQWWRFKHHALLTALHRPSGDHLRFGPPKRRIDPVNPYYGYEATIGRPRKANKLSDAEKQKRYRERQKARKLK
jgi:hypothetical protein